MGQPAASLAGGRRRQQLLLLLAGAVLGQAARLVTRRALIGRRAPAALLFPGQRPACQAAVRQLCRSLRQLQSCLPRPQLPCPLAPAACPMSHATSHPLLALIGQLASANRSLAVCVYAFTSADLAALLLELRRRRGVDVRVVCDSEQQHAPGSVCQRLRSAGVQVRTDSTSFFMHHKFCIVDGRLLLTGSFNWTQQAAVGNWENVVAVTDRAVVRQFEHEFERLWLQFAPPAV